MHPYLLIKDFTRSVSLHAKLKGGHPELPAITTSGRSPRQSDRRETLSKVSGLWTGTSNASTPTRSSSLAKRCRYLRYTTESRSSLSRISLSFHTEGTCQNNAREWSALEKPNSHKTFLWRSISIESGEQTPETWNASYCAWISLESRSCCSRRSILSSNSLPTVSAQKEGSDPNDCSFHRPLQRCNIRGAWRGSSISILSASSNFSLCFSKIGPKLATTRVPFLSKPTQGATWQGSVSENALWRWTIFPFTWNVTWPLSRQETPTTSPSERASHAFAEACERLPANMLPSSECRATQPVDHPGISFCWRGTLVIPIATAAPAGSVTILHSKYETPLFPVLERLENEPDSPWRVKTPSEQATAPPSGKKPVQVTIGPNTETPSEQSPQLRGFEESVRGPTTFFSPGTDAAERGGGGAADDDGEGIETTPCGRRSILVLTVPDGRCLIFFLALFEPDDRCFILTEFIVPPPSFNLFSLFLSLSLFQKINKRKFCVYVFTYARMHRKAANVYRSIYLSLLIIILFIDCVCAAKDPFVNNK